MRYLFVVAHPDDEVLGAGATISSLVEEGHEVTVMTLSMYSPTRKDTLLTEQAESHKILGVKKAINKCYETMKLGTYSRYEMVQDIEEAIITETPDIIVTHNPDDIHNDHRITSTLVNEAARLPQRGIGYTKPITALMHMEVLSSTEWNFGSSFSPNAFSPVNENHIQNKTAAIACYDKVIRAVPHPRNLETIKALARYRGSQCGAEYAEAFNCRYLDISALNGGR